MFMIMEIEIRVIKFVNNKETKLFVKRMPVKENFPFANVLSVLKLLYPDGNIIQLITFV